MSKPIRTGGRSTASSRRSPRHSASCTTDGLCRRSVPVRSRQMNRPPMASDRRPLTVGQTIRVGLIIGGHPRGRRTSTRKANIHPEGEHRRRRRTSTRKKARTRPPGEKQASSSGRDAQRAYRCNDDPAATAAPGLPQPKQPTAVALIAAATCRPEHPRRYIREPARRPAPGGRHAGRSSRREPRPARRRPTCEPARRPDPRHPAPPGNHKSARTAARSTDQHRILATYAHELTANRQGPDRSSGGPTRPRPHRASRPTTRPSQLCARLDGSPLAVELAQAGWPHSSGSWHAG
jgi:hypothetical protein